MFSELIGSALGAYGEKPQQQYLPQLDFGIEGGKANAANLQNLPGLEQIGGRVNQWNLGQSQDLLSGMMPGYKGLASQWSSNLSDLLAGKVSQEDASANLRFNAAWALGSGLQGSPSHGDRVARDYGWRSSELRRQGEQLAPSYFNTMAGLAPKSFDLASGLFSPRDVAAYDASYNKDKYASDVYNAKLDAA